MMARWQPYTGSFEVRLARAGVNYGLNGGPYVVSRWFWQRILNTYQTTSMAARVDMENYYQSRIPIRSGKGKKGT